MNTPAYVSLTDLGKRFGVGPRDVGLWLKALGLRQPDGRPTPRAVEEGFVLERLLEHGGSWWLWHEKKTSEVLAGMAEQTWPKIVKFEDFTVIRGT